MKKSSEGKALDKKRTKRRIKTPKEICHQGNIPSFEAQLQKDEKKKGGGGCGGTP